MTPAFSSRPVCSRYLSTPTASAACCRLSGPFSSARHRRRSVSSIARRCQSVRPSVRNSCSGSVWAGTSRTCARSTGRMAGYCSASTHSGMTRSGPRDSAPFLSQRMALSPPSANEVENNPLTRVFPLAHADAPVCEQGRAVLDQRNIGRRAADVDHDRVLLPGQRAAAERGRRRAGQQSFNRVLSRVLESHQARVRAHDQDFGMDAACAKTRGVTAAIKSCVMGSRPR